MMHAPSGLVLTTLEGQRVGILASRPIKSLPRGEARAEAHIHSEDGKARHICRRQRRNQQYGTNLKNIHDSNLPMTRR